MLTSYVFIFETFTCGIVLIYMEIANTSLGFRHNTILFIYTYVCSVD